MSKETVQQFTEQETSTPSTSKWICTANHGFAPYAQEELRRTFGSVKSTMLVPGEVFATVLPHSAFEVTERIRGVQPIFLRHMFLVGWESNLEHGEQEPWLEHLAAYILRHTELTHSTLTIQTRKSETSIWNGSAAELKDVVQDQLEDLQADFVVKDAQWIVSVFAGKDQIFAGVSKPEDNLSDWNGGAIRFQREEGQISRAKFKLLEAERTFGIDFGAFHEALDIGAAPGGWTSFLLERGLKVTAVDPAKMHPSLMSSPRLTHLRKNADSVSFKENQFDLMVCDMSWSPKLTAKLVTELLYALVPGGTAIVTVKLLTKKPMALIHDVMETFESAKMQIQRAKQLFHNRDEITLYMIKY